MGGIRLARGGIGIWLRRASAAVALALTGAVVIAGHALADGGTTHVDCQASPFGADGSAAHPLTSLADASTVPLTPGSSLLLRRGTECSGMLDLSGAGSESQPATISTYGTGTAPAIRGTGETAILLANTAHTVIEGLDVSNPGNGSGRKRGVHVIAFDQDVTGLTIRNMVIHDVGGDLDKDAGGSGGIQVDSAAGGRLPGLEISGNAIRDVSRSGIFVIGTSAGSRPRAGEEWPEASRGVVIEDNVISRTAGDGIVSLGTDGAVLRRNLVQAGNLAGRGLYDPAGMVCSAGIWAFNSNSTLIEENEVSGMEFNGCDGTAFDVDYEQDGTVIQRNTSHDNEGGFLLLCTDTVPREADVRFNLSVNDGYMPQSSPCGRITGNYSNLRVYNNTVLAPDPRFGVLGNPSRKLFGPQDLALFNNLVVATGKAGGFECGPACSHNLFYGLPPAGTDAIRSDPLFVSPGPHAGDPDPARFRLSARSPARGAGIGLPGDATADFFGWPLRPSDPVNIGFDQGPAPRPPEPMLRNVRLKPQSFRPVPGRGSTLGRRGARLSFRTGSAGILVLQIRGTGRRRGVSGTVRHPVPAGSSILRFTGRLNQRALRPGTYRLTVRLKSAGSLSPSRTLSFRILG